MLGTGDFTLPETQCTHYSDLDALCLALPDGAALPDAVFVAFEHAHTARETTTRALALLQA